MRLLNSGLMVTALVITLQSGLVSAEPKIRIDTSMGAITVDLDKEKAPNTVANFLTYVDSGYYTDTLFHRVIPKFMIQGGGFTDGMKNKPANTTVKNEAMNGLKNKRGTIAMARTNNPHSASSQFFINTVDNGMLDHTGETPRGWGYAVFGKVTDGMDVIDKIESTPTAREGRHGNVPTDNVVIKGISVLADAQ